MTGEFFRDLRRRNVFHVAAIYTAVAWAATEILVFVFERFGFPEWLSTLTTIVFVMGFPIAVFLAWMFDIGPGGIKRTAPSSARGRLTIALAVLLMLAGTTGLFYLIEPRSSERPATDEPFEPPARSVAVLPFSDLTPGADHEWLGDGMAEALLHTLAQHATLHVIARTSAFAFKDQNVDVRDIGRQLNVRAVLEGSVQRTANTLRITAQLVETAEGRHLWSMRYDRPADDIFEIQDEIAAAVTSELLDTLHPQKPAVRGYARTRDLSAYDDYMLGRFHWHQRTKESIQQSIEYFQSAISMDPDYALAYSGLADAYSVLPDYSRLLPGDVIEPARQAAERALELAPDLAEAHASLGLVHMREGDYETADSTFQHALELNPNYAMAHLWHGRSLQLRERYREAFPHFQRALKLDPLAPVVNLNAANVHMWLGHYEEAAATYMRALELSPGLANAAFGIAVTHHQSGALDEAADWYQKTLELGWRDSLTLRELALLYLELGDDPTADHWLAAAETAADDAFTWYGRKLFLMTRGETEALTAAALANLERWADDPFAIADAGFAEAYRGHCEAAVSLYARLPRDGEFPPPLYHAWDVFYGYSHAVNLLRCYRQLGASAESAALQQQIVAYLDRLAGQAYAGPGLDYVQAELAAINGDLDTALDRLRRAVAKGWRNHRRARHDPNLAVLSTDPRFLALMDEVAQRVAALRARMAQARREKALRRGHLALHAANVVPLRSPRGAAETYPRIVMSNP